MPGGGAGYVPFPESVDRERIENLRQLGAVSQRDLVGELATMFLDIVPLRFAAMNDALAALDGPKLGAAAHSLRGSAGNFGLVQLSAICELIERKAGEGRPQDCATPLDQAAAELERLRPWLESLGAPKS
jgi:HPt (histidine-containing phosphotransfer) domain-containing protein